MTDPTRLPEQFPQREPGASLHPDLQGLGFDPDHRFPWFEEGEPAPGITPTSKAGPIGPESVPSLIYDELAGGAKTAAPDTTAPDDTLPGLVSLAPPPDVLADGDPAVDGRAALNPQTLGALGRAAQTD